MKPTTFLVTLASLATASASALGIITDDKVDCTMIPGGPVRHTFGRGDRVLVMCEGDGFINGGLYHVSIEGPVIGSRPTQCWVPVKSVAFLQQQVGVGVPKCGTKGPRE